MSRYGQRKTKITTNKASWAINYTTLVISSFASVWVVFIWVFPFFIDPPNLNVTSTLEKVGQNNEFDVVKLGIRIENNSKKQIKVTGSQACVSAFRVQGINSNQKPVKSPTHLVFCKEAIPENYSFQPGEIYMTSKIIFISQRYDAASCEIKINTAFVHQLLMFRTTTSNAGVTSSAECLCW